MRTEKMSSVSLMVILVLSFLAFHSEASAFSITGTVRDISGNVPIQGAVVTIRSVDASPPVTVATPTTDALGNYTATLPSAGSYDIPSVTKAGYTMLSAPSFPYDVGGAYPVDVTADPIYLIFAGIKSGHDFNADGNPDIFWRNTSTGVNVFWYITSGNLTGFGQLPSIADPAWTVAGIADFNGDGNPDILWRNTSTGVNVFWYITSGNLTGFWQLPSVAGSDWTIVGR